MDSDDELDDIDRELADIRKSTRRIKSDEHAYAILGNLVAATSRINGLIAPPPRGPPRTARSIAPALSAVSKPSTLSRLQNWIQEIKSSLEALARYLKAASYTVGVSVPLGLSMSLTFSIEAAESPGTP